MEKLFTSIAKSLPTQDSLWGVLAAIYWRGSVLILDPRLLVLGVTSEPEQVACIARE